MTLLLIYLTIALVVSFLCSLLEASLLSVPRSHIEVLVERGKPAGVLLQKMKKDVDRPLAAILTLNTFAHTLGAAGVGAQAAVLWGEAWVGLVSFVLTLLVLIFSEIIPKTLGAVHAKRLAGFTAWTIRAMILMLLPAVVACNWMSRLLSSRTENHGHLSRDEVRGLIRLAEDHDAIDADEARVMRNLIALRDISISEVMTPRTVVTVLRADQTIEEATHGNPPRFARVPVIGQSIDDIQGVVHRHDLFSALSDGRSDTKLADLAKPVHVLPGTAKLPAALDEFLKRKEHLFIVVDEYGGTAGIITLEDVLETLLGIEIVDETDSAADMQQLALQLQAQRVARKPL